MPAMLTHLHEVCAAGGSTGPVNGQVIGVSCNTTGLTPGQQAIVLTASTATNNGCPHLTQMATANITIRPSPVVQLSKAQPPAPGCNTTESQTVTATFSYSVIPSPGSGALQLTASAAASQAASCTITPQSKQ